MRGIEKRCCIEGKGREGRLRLRAVLRNISFVYYSYIYRNKWNDSEEFGIVLYHSLYCC